MTMIFFVKNSTVYRMEAQNRISPVEKDISSPSAFIPMNFSSRTQITGKEINDPHSRVTQSLHGKSPQHVSIVIFHGK